MAIKLKPKHYGPLRLTSVKAGTLTYTSEAGYQAMAGAPASTELAAPSDLIMAALASCIAISLEMAAQERKVDPGKIDVEVNGTKARDLPHRFGGFSVTVYLADIEDQELAARRLKQAKQICTVSNTLNSEVSVSLREKR